MKKIIIILFILIVILVGVREKNNLFIPKEAIRFRIIANSNEQVDQNLKQTIKDEVENELENITKDAQNIKEARTLINDNLFKVDKIIQKYDVDYEINFGQNYFPQKEYKGLTYDEGEYESLVITLGEGKGKNWWCVLFPPLCLLEKENFSEVEYKLYAQELINKFTNN